MVKIKLPHNSCSMAAIKTESDFRYLQANRIPPSPDRTGATGFE